MRRLRRRDRRADKIVRLLSELESALQERAPRAQRPATTLKFARR